MQLCVIYKYQTELKPPWGKFLICFLIFFANNWNDRVFPLCRRCPGRKSAVCYLPNDSDMLQKHNFLICRRPVTPVQRWLTELLISLCLWVWSSWFSAARQQHINTSSLFWFSTRKGVKWQVVIVRVCVFVGACSGLFPSSPTSSSSAAALACKQQLQRCTPSLTSNSSPTSAPTRTHKHTRLDTHAHSDHVVQFIYHNSRRNSTLYMSMRCIHLTFNPRSQWHTHTVTNPHRGSTAHAHSLLLCRTSSAVQDVFLIFHFLPKVQIQTVWVQS